MTGSYDIVVQNRRVQYKFSINRNLTILRGDSATGKTTLIQMIAAYEDNGPDSGISLSCERPCGVLTGRTWKRQLTDCQDSILFIDEGEKFAETEEFARAARDSSNYYVLATRNNLFNLPYSVVEIYGIRNTSGNRYQGTKRLYSTFYPLYSPSREQIMRPDLVVVEDSNSGYEFFSSICADFGIRCVSAGGKSNIWSFLREAPEENVLVIADGAAFGPEIGRIISMKTGKNIGLYLPESFEWMILRSGLLRDAEVGEVLTDPAAFIDSSRYFSWEQFFTALLQSRSHGTYLQYQKGRLNPVYLQPHEKDAILSIMPDDLTNLFPAPLTSES